MNMSKEYRALGMGRAIPRRDFLNGVAIGITGVYAALNGLTADAGGQTSIAAGGEDYPPLRSGLRGQYPGAVEEFGRMRQGKYAQFPVSDGDIHEEYDLVIVGGGISGLSAAYFYRTALGSAQRILILDNHD
ncbi:MAG TPA: NAD(P)-binding protein, partial [Candidatus Angelobacter sp.]|nr:NAD(P)-binding protein [Candidatus Angelobacter sp.]